jgi:hypothetical protein
VSGGCGGSGGRGEEWEMGNWLAKMGVDTKI